MSDPEQKKVSSFDLRGTDKAGAWSQDRLDAIAAQRRTGSDGEVIVGQRPTEEEEDLAAWGKDACRNSLECLTEAFVRLLALSTILLGGSVALIGEQLVWGPARILVIVLLMGSLLLSLQGVMPIAVDDIDPRCVDDVRRIRNGAIHSRSRLLRWAGALLLGAFGAALAGIIVRAIYPLP